MTGSNSDVLQAIDRQFLMALTGSIFASRFALVKRADGSLRLATQNWRIDAWSLFYRGMCPAGGQRLRWRGDRKGSLGTIRG